MKLPGCCPAEIASIHLSSIRNEQIVRVSIHALRKWKPYMEYSYPWEE
jgi:hypothetical protein